MANVNKALGPNENNSNVSNSQNVMSGVTSVNNNSRLNKNQNAPKNNDSQQQINPSQYSNDQLSGDKTKANSFDKIDTKAFNAIQGINKTEDELISESKAKAPNMVQEISKMPKDLQVKAVLVSLKNELSAYVDFNIGKNEIASENLNEMMKEDKTTTSITTGRFLNKKTTTTTTQNEWNLNYGPPQTNDNINLLSKSDQKILNDGQTFLYNNPNLQGDERLGTHFSNLEEALQRKDPDNVRSALKNILEINNQMLSDKVSSFLKDNLKNENEVIIKVSPPPAPIKKVEKVEQEQVENTSSFSQEQLDKFGKQDKAFGEHLADTALGQDLMLNDFIHDMANPDNKDTPK
jgi:hypothetical protein